MGRVHAGDVQGRVRLGQPGGLGFGEDLGVGHPLGGHAGEDVVARAVDDAVDRLDLVGQQPGQQRADHRHAADATGLEGDAHPPGPRQGVQFGAVVGQQGLVGGDHVLTRAQRPGDDLSRDGRAADQFDDDLRVRVVEHLGQVAADQLVGHAGRAGARGVRLDHVAKRRPDAAARVKAIGLFQQHLGHVAAHGAASDQRHPGAITYRHVELLDWAAGEAAPHGPAVKPPPARYGAGGGEGALEYLFTSSIRVGWSGSIVSDDSHSARACVRR